MESILNGNQFIYIVTFEFHSPSGEWCPGIDCYESLEDANDKADTMRIINNVYRNILVIGRDVQTRDYVRMIKGTTA